MAAMPSNPAPDNIGGFFVMYGVIPAHIDPSTGFVGAALTQSMPAGMNLLFVPPGQSLPQTLPLWPTVLNQAASTATRSFDQSVATPTPAATQASSAANGEGGGAALRRRELARSTTPLDRLRSLATPSRRRSQSVAPMTPLEMLMRRRDERTPIRHATPTSAARPSPLMTVASLLRTSKQQSVQGKKRSSEGDGGASGAIAVKREAADAAETAEIQGQIMEWYENNVTIACKDDPEEMARMNEKALDVLRKVGVMKKKD